MSLCLRGFPVHIPLDWWMKMNMNLRMAVTVGLVAGALAAVAPHNMNASSSTTATKTTELATFGGGCFWCMEAVFQQLDGVKSVTSGYAGGTKANPTYKEVCQGDTGHAEVIQIEFDPKKISFEQLLDVFWEAHDPTTLNRQGPDTGMQYRSIILYQNHAQKAAAEKSRAQAAKQFSKPIVTEIVPLTAFYKAEGYHQDYYRNNPNQAYCQVVIRPKLEKLQKMLNRHTPP